MRCLLPVLILAAVPHLTVAQTAVVDSGEFDQLRAAARTHRDSFEVQLAYGRVLARSASEREGDWRARSEAERQLERAFRLRTEDPRPYLELGVLKRKMGMRVDGLRVLKRSEERAERMGGMLDSADRAELHYQLGLIYEVWWEDWANLGYFPWDFARGSCSEVEPLPGLPSLVAINFVCPDVFEEMMRLWRPMWELKQSEFDAMVNHFRKALEYDPRRADAGLRLLRHLADGRQWTDYLMIARRLASLVPTDPYVLMFLGLGYQQTGRRERADSVFTRAIVRADSALRREMLRPEQLLRERDSTAYVVLGEDVRGTLETVFWRARDPLFLTPENERLAEHLARFAYVELAFTSPQSGLRGRWSDRGEAWMRYGRPRQIRVLQVDNGRIEFWDYGRDSPDLVFRRPLTYRRARHEELSEEYADYARRHVPELHVPVSPRIVASIPFQAASFRGTDGNALLEVYAAVPGAALRGASDLAVLEAGVFVVTGDFWEPSGGWRDSVPNVSRDTPLDAAFDLPAGRYVVSAEAMAGDVAAQRRLRVTVPTFGDTLALSDLLLADRFGVEVPRVEQRHHLAPAVSPTLQFAEDAPIGVIWEIYDLTTDSIGLARYNVRLGVEDATERSAAARLLRDLAGVTDQRARLTWEVERRPRSDGAVVEFVTIELTDASPGPHRLLVTVVDRLTGRSIETYRNFTVVEAPEPGG